MTTHKRIDFFKSVIPNHAFYKILYNKLSNAEIAVAELFIQKTSNLTNEQYCGIVLRQEYEDQIKSLKRHLIVNELLLVAATMEQSWSK